MIWIVKKRPVEVEAIQYVGSNLEEVLAFAGDAVCVDSRTAKGWSETIVYIHTPEGKLRVSINDWIIKGVMGEFYPCDPEVFDLTYVRMRRKRENTDSENGERNDENQSNIPLDP